MDEKLDLTSRDNVNENFKKLAGLFPNCVTESAEGNVIDFDRLKQELSHKVVEGNKERYRLEWPGKREAIVEANLPTTKTLKPIPEDSVDFETTQNIYIEGDNLEVLKILQESYLGKIKVIYIDPPYNTGQDFVYVDNFSKKRADSNLESGLIDEAGRKLSALKNNPATDARYHSDWLTMIYPRLKLARNLLKDDGVIFISIDDNEVHNLIKVCDEIFGEMNYVGMITWLKKRKGSFLSKKIVSITEYCLVYGKTADVKLFGGKPDASESQPLVKRTNAIGKLNFPGQTVKTKLPDGIYEAKAYGDGSSAVKLLNEIEIKDGVIVTAFSLEGPFIWGQTNLNTEIKDGATVIINTLNFQPRVFKSEDADSFKGMLSSINGVDISGTNEDGYEELRDLLGAEKIMDYPKPVNYIRSLIGSQSYFDRDAIVLDFFSGSATTGHATMLQNAREGTNLKYMLVQLPEETVEKSAAGLAGYKNICDIGKERLRKAAIQLKQDTGAVIDYGFKVYRLADSNMNDVFHKPAGFAQRDLELFADSVKPGTKPEDLLVQVMLDLGFPLSARVTQHNVAGKNVFKVTNENIGKGLRTFYACFENGVDNSFAEAIAIEKPPFIVFRDHGFKDDTAKTNVKQSLKQLSPDTTVKVI